MLIFFQLLFMYQFNFDKAGLTLSGRSNPHKKSRIRRSIGQCELGRGLSATRSARLVSLVHQLARGLGIRPNDISSSVWYSIGHNLETTQS